MNGRDLSPAQLAEVLGDFANGSHRKGKEVGEACTREHRTLQRNIFCLCLDIVDAFADMEDNQVDLRNQGTRDEARKIKKLTGGGRPWLV